MEVFPILSYRGSRVVCAGMSWFVPKPTNNEEKGLYPPIESTNSQDRKTSKFSFTLKNEHLAKLANRSCVRPSPVLSHPLTLPQTTVPTPPLLHLLPVLHPDRDSLSRSRLPDRVPADMRSADQQPASGDQLSWDQEETRYCSTC